MSNYVLNTWYPLTWSRNVGHALTAHQILEQQVVLYRTEGGKVIAMEDACPHRLLPLSMGKLRGDAIECGYHGMTYDCSGKCVRVPGQDLIPSSAFVRTYPIHENMGLVWIWMGDPAMADPGKVFDLPQYHDPRWSAVEGDALEIKANYLNLADNLCDPAHVSFVHLSTLGNAASEDVPVHSEQQDGKVVTWRWVIDAPPIPLFAKHGHFKGNVDRWHYYYYHAPSIAVIDFGSAETGTGAPEGRRDNCIQIFACHFITPVDQDTCIDHWLHVKNFQADAQVNAELSADFRVAFSEDKTILEAIQRNERRLPSRRTVKIAIDAGSQRMRRLVERMREAEAPTA
ncbi:aromatic ring-hydroxylating dioxygenase subunit alpha [Ramlibacter sp. 2FC]|uniref:aromatic ring-hydroxylating dioxygenase subunit alpha n=1 Tax=Ramlibacter sp. 2FC TaxID=2502188 RepID=UPI0010F74FE0|nr:aromatic ring-hydroxylating dioxygenase subunit alpha [Ramlibacter sp. 2FC]